MKQEKKKKKLLVDLTPLDTPSRQRGIGRYIRELAIGLQALPESALEGIELLGLTSFGWTGRFSVTRDLASFEGDPRIAAPTESDFLRWAWRYRVALWRSLRAIGADALHVTDAHATPLLQWATGTKKIVTCHDLIPLRFPEQYLGWQDGGRWMGHRIQERRYRSADLVVAISEATRRDVIDLAGVRPERVVTVLNGFDVARWSAPSSLDARAVLDARGLVERRFLLYVGGSDHRKNVEGMFGALARVRAMGEDLRLTLAGDLSPGHLARVDALARSAGVRDAVDVLGYVDDDELQVLYRASLAHLFVSRCEGFGLTVVEAMAAGCPVVTTAASALAEVAGDAALTVDPEDHEAIAQAILRLAREPGLRDDLVRKGMARAPTFDRAIQARAMAAVYRRFFGL